ncbi:uncharacterized protein LOC129299906 isoform X7 [Prosopis cineraria]|uniref:uncharacterized protein LOC129299906 isoform X7 n=1 Tax=Prosopis cineraria TaxID=364024 RepID=UPI00240FA3C9|nr:uncharacterized protein LOC129299906 isoform X7 [Prosopis cineraria]
MLPKLRGMLIPKASELERVLGDEEAEAMPIKETLIPNMKVAILLQLPKLTAHSLNIHNLQSVRYLVVDQCPQLSAALSPTIAPLDLLQLLENDPDYEGFDWQWGALLRTMRMDVEDNEQELTPIASPNLTQGVEEPKEQCSAGGDANISEQKCIEEFEKQSSDDDLHLAEQKETVTLPMSVEEYEKQSFDDDTNIAEKKGVKGSSILEKATITTPTMQLDPSSSLQGSLVSSLPKALPQNVKGRFDSPTPENAKEGSSSTNSEQISLVQSSLKPIKVNQTEVDVEVVVKAFADLKVCLKIPLKDIATSESNSLHLLIALNFLSRLSFEDGTLSHELKATIQSLLQDFPSILCSFKSAFATINKFPKNETQEKEFTKLKEKMTVLEKEKQDCEVKISSLQDKKKNCVAEIIELENEFDNVTKEKNEMMEHQRKARQQLFEADYKWSILCSQFQLNKIVARNHF